MQDECCKKGTKEIPSSHKLGAGGELLVDEISKDVTREVNYSGPVGGPFRGTQCKKLPGDLAYFCD